MKNIAVIGAGQLGGRHVQALVKNTFPWNLLVVDPDVKALESIGQRLESDNENICRGEVRYLNSIDQLGEVLDFCIIATGADVRLQVLEQLVTGRRIAALLLEKVLFQRMKDYRVAETLINRSKINTWVNCPRRVYAIYGEIRKLLGKNRVIKCRIHGGDWGLACNAIHFLDLVAFFTGARLESVDASSLDGVVRSSKRENFVEFTGTLDAFYSDGSELVIRSDYQSSAPLMIEIESGALLISIVEQSGIAVIADTFSGEERKLEFRVPFISDLMTDISSDIILNGSCGLTTFRESRSIHLPFIDSLLLHMDRVTGERNAALPIT